MPVASQSDGWLDQEGDFSRFALSGAVTYKPTSDLRFTLSNDHGDQSPMRYLGTPLINGSPILRFTNFNVRDSELDFRDNWTQLKTEWDQRLVQRAQRRLPADQQAALEGG